MLYTDCMPYIDGDFASCWVLPDLSLLWTCGIAGAGMIFSQGLMRMRPYDEIEEAVRTMNWAHQGAGGDPLTPPPLPPPPLACLQARCLMFKAVPLQQHKLSLAMHGCCRLLM